MNQPTCPKCCSRVVLFRQKDSSYGCCRCWHRWSESQGDLPIRVTNVRFIPAKAIKS
jgi:uncharacterized Zn ribbon protein